MTELSNRMYRIANRNTTISTHALPNLTEEEQCIILYFMFVRETRREFLYTFLKRFNIPHRTRIYNVFGHSWSVNNQDHSESNRLACAREILQHTDIHQWLAVFILEYPLKGFLGLLEEIFALRKDTFEGIPLIIRPNEQNT